MCLIRCIKKSWSGLHLRKVLMYSFYEAAIKGGPILGGDTI